MAADGTTRDVRLTGHLDGAARDDLLRGSWLLLNTSIHEGLPVSFLDGLAAGLPLVSCVDPEGVVSRFGACVGMYEGDGLDAVEPLATAVRSLVADPGRRSRLAAAGRRWVAGTHTPAHFVAALVEQLPRLGALGVSR